MTKSKKRGVVRKCFAQIYAQVAKLTPTKVKKNSLTEQRKKGVKDILAEISTENNLF